jgi:hypothetical protein
MAPVTDVTVRTIVLTGEDNWDMWIQVIKTLALGYEIWDFIDPEGEEETILVEPARPDPEDPDYLVQVEDWRRQIRAYDHKKKGFIQVRSKIQETIDIDLLHYTFDCDTVRQSLKNLSRRYAPTAESRRDKIIAKYTRLRTTPPNGTAIDEWLAEWEGVYAAGKRIKLPDFEDRRTIKDFVNIVPDTGFADYWRNRIQDQGIPENMDFYTLIQKYREVRTEKYANHIRMHGAFHVQKPTLGRQRDCLCGEDHRFAECPYLILSKREEGWIPNPGVQNQIDQKLERSEALRTTVLRLQKEDKEKAAFTTWMQPAQEPPFAF